jgi:hypothetical protein
VWRRYVLPVEVHSRRTDGVTGRTGAETSR